MLEEESPRLFITGAASGLGRALAIGYARRGGRIGIADVNDDRARETAAVVSAAGGEPLVLHCDIRDDDQVRAAAGEVEKTWGGVDIVINNAGVAAAGTVTDTDVDDWRWIIDINLLGAVRVCQAFVPLMQRSREGHVVNVASRVTDTASGGVSLITRDVREAAGSLPMVSYTNTRSVAPESLTEDVEVSEVTLG